jgi:hypothetical protein
MGRVWDVPVGRPVEAMILVQEMFMKLLTYSALAIAACALAVPLASAQTTTGKSQNEQTTTKPSSDSTAKPDTYAAQGAQKQRTQGLPSALVPGSGSSWNSNSQASKSQ